MHFCESTARVYGRLSVPINTSLNWTMPEFVKRSVLSPPGTSDMDGTAVCPCSTKKSMKVCRISLPVIFLVIRTSEKLVWRLYQWMKLSNNVMLPKGHRLWDGVSGAKHLDLFSTIH